MKRCKTIEFGKLAQQLETRDLGTRFAGASMREMIVTSFNDADELIVDFSGIETISHAFADECFAKMLGKYDFNSIKEKITFQNTSPIIKIAVTRAFKERLSSKRRALIPA
jgi:hypothetical protein